jgi:hypothetical protein
MAGYHVWARVRGPRQPSEALAFLAPMRARAAYNAGRLAVDLEVEATDVADALAVAKERVLDRLPGTVEVVTVTSLDGLLLPPGRLFRRRRVGRKG